VIDERSQVIWVPREVSSSFRDPRGREGLVEAEICDLEVDGWEVVGHTRDIPVSMVVYDERQGDHEAIMVYLQRRKS
jgi:hypothetical protein